MLTPLYIVQRRDEAETQLIEAEVASRRFDTTERCVTLFWRSIFCFMTAILIGITVYCYLQDSHAVIPLVTGPLGITTGIRSYTTGLRAKINQP